MKNDTNPIKTILENALTVLLMIFVILVPYTLHLSSYIIAAIGVLALGYRIAFGKFTEFNTPAWKRFAWFFAPMAVIYLLDLIGMFYTPVPKEGGIILERNLSFIAFPVIFLLLGLKFFTPQRLKVFALTFCFACLILVSFFFINFGLALSTNDYLKSLQAQHQWGTLISSFAAYPHDYLQQVASFHVPHHTFQAWYILIAMSIMVYTAVVYPAWYKPLYRKIAGVLLMLLYIGVGIVLAMSKMGWLVFGFWCLLILIFLLGKKQYKTVVGGSALLLSVVLALYLFTPHINQLAGRAYRVFSNQIVNPNGQSATERDGSVYPRVQLWKEAVRGIQEKPLFGWGTAGEKVVLHPDRHGLGDLIQDPHNQWLLLGIRFGVMGILAFAWLWFAGFRQAYRSKDYLLFLFLMVSLCFTMTDRTLDIQQGITFFCLAYGLFMAFSFIGQGDSGHTEAKRTDSPKPLVSDK